MLNRSELPIDIEVKMLPDDFPLSIQRYTQQYRQQATLHYHNCMEIGQCVSGNGMMFIDGTVYSFVPGSISLIPNGCIHDSRIIMSNPSDKPSVWRFIFVDMKRLGLSMETQSGFVTGSRKIFNLFDVIFTVSEEKASLWQKETVHLLSALALEADRVGKCPAVENENPYRELILLSQHKIAMEYDTELTVEGLAQFCNLSVSCFRKYFTLLVGMPPQQYIIHMRLSVAEHLLRNSDEKMIAVAQKVGFQTLSSFNRLFLRQYGCTPSALRKAL